MSRSLPRSAWPRAAWCLVFAGLQATMLFAVGCAPLTARRLAQAPNTFPKLLTPRPRVTVDHGDFDLRQFPVRELRVGPDHATLRYRVVEPGDYRLQMKHAWETHREPARMRVTFRALQPGEPLPGLGTPRGTVVLLHGYGMEMSSLLPWALRLAADGWRCILVDLRGHGKSTGPRIYFGTLEALELAQLLDELERSGEGVPPVTTLGESYGASLALRWAARDARLERVVALAPYPELRRATLNLRAEFVPWFPQSWLRAALDQLPRVLAVRPESLDPITAVAGQPVRALLVAGGADRIAPPADVERLARALPGRSEFFMVEGVAHEGLGLRLDLLGDRVRAWLAEASAEASIAPFPGPPSP